MGERERERVRERDARVYELSDEAVGREGRQVRAIEVAGMRWVETPPPRVRTSKSSDSSGVRGAEMRRIVRSRQEAAITHRVERRVRAGVEASESGGVRRCS